VDELYGRGMDVVWINGMEGMDVVWINGMEGMDGGMDKRYGRYGRWYG
jgi:hypothetical protein